MAGPLGTGKNYPGLVPKFINFEEFFNFTICSKLWQYEMEVWQIDEFYKTEPEILPLSPLCSVFFSSHQIIGLPAEL